MPAPRTSPEVSADGTQRWLADGVPHREDGPAVIKPGGSRCWYRHGLRHREGGPAIEMSSGTVAYFDMGKRHRDDGPAIIFADGRSRWWVKGELHREDGPAIEDNDGVDSGRWYIRGRQLTDDEIAQRRREQAAREESIAIAGQMQQGLPRPLRCGKPLALK